MGSKEMTYFEQLEAAGHVLKRDEDGEIDSWAMEWGYHNGPRCVNCNDSWCEHCQDNIKPCIGKEAYEAECKALRYQQYLKLKEEFDV